MQRLKILIVEDESITAMDIQETLEEAGHTVLAITDKYENSLEAIQSYRPDLAVVDIKLKDSTADGIFLAKELWQKYQIPVIFLTANAELKTVQRAKEASPTAYLLKPFRPEELLIQIELAWSYYTTRQESTRHSIFVPIKYQGHKRLDINQVLYVQASGSDSHIYISGEDSPLVVSTNLANVLPYFCEAYFFKLSRSLIINVEQIDKINGEKLYLKSGKHTITLSPDNRKELLKRLKVVKTKP